MGDVVLPTEVHQEEGDFSSFRFCSVLVLLTLYFWGIQTLGYYLATPLFVFGLLLVLGVRSYRGLLVPTLSLVVIWSILFHYVLGVPLPPGPLFLWFG